MQTREEKRAYHTAWMARDYAANPEKYKARVAKWKADNPEKSKAVDAKWRAANLERVKSNQAQYRAANPEKISTLNKKWRSRNRARTVELKRKSRYGISAFDYNRMSDDQHFLCAICDGVIEDKKSKLKGRAKPLHIDHCHRTLKVRGLLCDNCNLALGGFKDSLGLLKRAMQYLLDRG